MNKIVTISSRIQFKGPEFAAQKVAQSRNENSRHLGRDLVPVPEVHQEPQGGHVDPVTDHGDHGISQILIPDGFDSLIVGFEGPAQIQDEIVGHGH